MIKIQFSAINWVLKNKTIFFFFGEGCMTSEIFWESPWQINTIYYFSWTMPFIMSYVVIAVELFGFVSHLITNCIRYLYICQIKYKYQLKLWELTFTWSHENLAAYNIETYLYNNTLIFNTYVVVDTYIDTNSLKKYIKCHLIFV